jgi:hypothetical protein
MSTTSFIITTLMVRGTCTSCNNVDRHLGTLSLIVQQKMKIPGDFSGEKIEFKRFNPGVGAYGTDRSHAEIRTSKSSLSKIVMLCIFPENINRVVNFYRPFYTYIDPVRLTKPLRQTWRRIQACVNRNALRISTTSMTRRS